jgi:hypothetical protein
MYFQIIKPNLFQIILGIYYIINLNFIEWYTYLKKKKKKKKIIIPYGSNINTLPRYIFNPIKKFTLL